MAKIYGTGNDDDDNNNPVILTSGGDGGKFNEADFESISSLLFIILLL